MSLKSLFKKLIPSSLIDAVRDPILGTRKYASYVSQNGEDGIIKGILYKKVINRERGFFVDVGACHPIKGSNTFYFYNFLGWRGISIDPVPGSMKEFNRIRPEDINLEIGISLENKPLTFYQNEQIPDKSTFNKEHSDKWSNEGRKEILVPTMTLEGMLDKYLPPNTQIDFLDVDVEGYDLNVLKSNNWKKYRPSVVVVEIFGNTLADILHDEVVKFMQSVDYQICAKNNVGTLQSNVFFTAKEYSFS